MKWSDLGKIVKPLAPILAAAIPGGGIATTILSEVFGTKNDPDAIAAAIEKDPAAGAKLLEIQNAHKQELEKIALQLELAEIADVQDARARDVSIIASGKTNVRADVLAALAICGLISIIVMLMFRPPAPENTAALTLLTTLAGTLVSCVTMVYTFEFGSSRSSRQKDATIASQSAAASSK